MKKQLLEARDLANGKLTALMDKGKAEKRTLTEDEMTEVRALDAELDSLSDQIKIAEKQEKREASLASAVTGTPVTEQSKEERKAVSRYSILRAIQSAMPGGQPLDGLEKEMDTEARQEARDAGIEEIAGGVSVPGILMRDNAVVPDAKGGYTVDSNIKEVISILRPKTAIRDAGATFLTGLQGNLRFPPQDAGATATWKTEVASLDEGTITFADAVMTPKRLGAYTPISLQLLQQSSIDIENFVRRDLENAVGQALETAAFNGSGTAPVPEGILNATGLQVEAIATDGGTMTFDHLVGLETLVANVNADVDKMGYITNTKLRGSLKTDRKDAGSGIMTWASEPGANMLNGYQAYVSNNMPSDLTKGTGTALSAMIFGNWADLLIGSWGGLNIIVDPYTQAKTGQVVLVVNSFWDILVRRVASFAAVVDATT